MDKRVKTSVDYSRGHQDSHCGKTFDDDKGYCKHFVPHRNDHHALPGTCTKVEGGISRIYWCKLFEKA
jgi:hypothetical protein